MRMLVTEEERATILADPRLGQIADSHPYWVEKYGRGKSIIQKIRVSGGIPCHRWKFERKRVVEPLSDISPYLNAWQR